jgi:hypothetical protein
MDSTINKNAGLKRRIKTMIASTRSPDPSVEGSRR